MKKVNLRWGWKVIYVAPTGQRSSPSGLSRITPYPRRCWVRPMAGDGPLAVFSGIRYAEAAFTLNDFMKVVPCLYVPSRRRGLWHVHGRRVERYPAISLLPRGTVFADAVICLE